MGDTAVARRRTVLTRGRSRAACWAPRADTRSASGSEPVAAGGTLQIHRDTRFIHPSIPSFRSSFTRWVASGNMSLWLHNLVNAHTG